MEIESKGSSTGMRMEVSFYQMFDLAYKGHVPIEVIPNLLIEGYSAQENASPESIIIYKAFVNTYFPKWKVMNGL